MRSDSISYLKKAGFDFKSAESPDIWSHLEDHFAAHPHRIGPKFVPMSGQMIADLIARGENALLDAMVAQHQHTGHIDHVEQMIEMPFIVGIDGTVAVNACDKACMIELIDQPGSPHERLIHVMLAEPDEIPGTHKVTVKGGLYGDGHTAGYYNLSPGDHLHETPSLRAWLATADEIAALARDMQVRADDITVVTRAECDAMMARVRQLLS